MKLMTTLIHETRNLPQGVRFSGDMVYIDLADGRFIGAPLKLFPRLQTADESQRQAHRFDKLSVHWDELETRIDLNAMLTGLYTVESEAGETSESAFAT